MKLSSLLLITTLSKHGHTQRKFQSLQDITSAEFPKDSQTQIQTLKSSMYTNNASTQSELGRIQTSVDA